MTRPQLYLILAAVLCLSILYFGLDTRSKDHKQVEASRALSAQSADPEVLMLDARKGLAQADQDAIHTLEEKAEIAADTAAKAEVYKTLSGRWFDLGHPEVAGYYARKVAEMLKTEEAWSMAGTTFTIGIRRVEDTRIKSYCSEQAIRAFEQAITLNPGNINHRVNLAICYAEFPPKDNPMKGILMLRELNEENPDNVLVLETLGKFAIQTGQFDKAIERLERALSLVPEDGEIPCYLAQAYTGAGQHDKAGQMTARCKK